jgi:hypothetical protein
LSVAGIAGTRSSAIARSEIAADFLTTLPSRALRSSLAQWVRWSDYFSHLAALSRLARDEDEGARERAERRALRIIGVCFTALAIYVAVDGIKALINREAPTPSAVGIVIAALSLVVMPVLVHLKRRVATQLNSGALEAETRQTAVCAFLSAILLVGLGLNAWLGWWWADPLAGLAMVPLIAKEGVEALRGETCCRH